MQCFFSWDSMRIRQINLVLEDKKAFLVSLASKQRGVPNHLHQHPTLSQRSGKALSRALCSMRANPWVVIEVKSEKHCMCILTVKFLQTQVVSLRSVCQSVFSLFCILDVYLASRLIRKQIPLFILVSFPPVVPAVNICSSGSQLNGL